MKLTHHVDLLLREISDLSKAQVDSWKQPVQLLWDTAQPSAYGRDMTLLFHAHRFGTVFQRTQTGCVLFPERTRTTSTIHPVSANL